jgi:hypothetical protein
MPELQSAQRLAREAEDCCRRIQELARQDATRSSGEIQELARRAAECCRQIQAAAR